MKHKQHRMSCCELAYRAAYLRTFDDECYELKGQLAVGDQGHVARLADIYYRIRSAKNHQHCQIAKRKKPEEELILHP